MKITFITKLFQDRPAQVGYLGLDHPQSIKALLFLLEAGININMEEMRNNDIPPVYKAGVRYRREKIEEWRDCITVWESGWGDCEDLVMYLVAQYRLKGIKAAPHLRTRITPQGNYLIHVLLRTKKGLEDPSKVLGMNKRSVMREIRQLDY